MARLLINVPKKQAFIYAAFLVLYEFLTYIANDMIMPGMINVVSSFHGPESAIAMSLTAYLLGGASLQLFLGPLSDRYGRRPIMIIGACLFFVCTLYIACTQTMNQFLLARFFQGTGLCFIGVIGYATLQEIFSEMDAIRLIAIMANVSITAPLIGPLLGVFFISYYSWRFIFVVISVLALVALWGLWRFMPEPVGQTKREGGTITRTSLSIRVVVSNYKQLLLNRSFMWGAIALGLINLPCLAWIGLAPIILVKEAKLSIFQYGVWQLPVFGACIVGNMLLHRMTHYFSLRALIGVGSLIAVGSSLMVYILPYFMGYSFIWLMPGLIFYFMGTGILCSPLSRFILFSTHVSKGTASALMSMISMCILSLGVEVANKLYASHDNRLFCLFCASTALLYCTALAGCFFKKIGSNSPGTSS